MTWRGNISTEERILGALPYILVLFYGYYGFLFDSSIFHVFPQISILIQPIIQPINQIFAFVPFASLVIFFCLLFFVVRNPKIAHFIRFNTMQALLLTLISYVVQLILSLLGTGGFLPAMLDSCAFLTVLATFIFAVVQSFRGLYPELPSISEAVYMQVG